MAEGWIKLHRSLMDHWLYKSKKPRTRREAWEDILMHVNYTDKKILIRGQLYECGRGQSLYSLETWASLFNWSKQQVRTFFDLLQNDKMIKIEGLQYTTRLTVCNYEYYQSEQHTNNTPITHGQHADNTPATPTKESKEGKEVKNIIPPTLEMVTAYCKERKNNIDPQYFIDWNQARGWIVGRNKMKDWQAAIRTWEQKSKQYAGNSSANSRNIKRTNKYWD